MDRKIMNLNKNLIENLSTLLSRHHGVLPCESIGLKIHHDANQLWLGYRPDMNFTSALRDFYSRKDFPSLTYRGDDIRNIIKKSIPVPIRVEITNQPELSFSTTFRLVINFYPHSEMNMYRFYQNVSNSDLIKSEETPVREYGLFIELENLVTFEFFRRNPKRRISSIFRITGMEDEQKRPILVKTLQTYHHFIYTLAKKPHSSFLTFFCESTKRELPYLKPHPASRIDEELFMYYIQSRAFSEARSQARKMKSDDFRSKIFSLVPLFFDDPKKFRNSAKNLLQKIERKILGSKSSPSPIRQKKVSDDTKVVPNSVIYEVFELLSKKKNDRRFGRLDIPLFRLFIHMVLLNALHLSDFHLAFSVGTRSLFFDPTHKLFKVTKLMMKQYAVALKSHTLTQKNQFENTVKLSSIGITSKGSKKVAEIFVFSSSIHSQYKEFGEDLILKNRLCRELIEYWTKIASGTPPEEVMLPLSLRAKLEKKKGELAIPFDQVFELIEYSCVLMIEKGFEEAFKLLYFFFFHQKITSFNTRKIEQGDILDDRSFSNLNNMLRLGNTVVLPFQRTKDRKDPFGAFSYSVLDEFRFYDILIRKYLQYSDRVFLVLKKIMKFEKKVTLEDIVIAFAELCVARGRSDLGLVYIQYGTSQTLKVLAEDPRVYFRLNRMKIEMLMMQKHLNESEVDKKIRSTVQFCVLMIEKDKVRSSLPKSIIREILELIRSGDEKRKEEVKKNNNLLFRVPCSFCEDVFVVVGLEGNEEDMDRVKMRRILTEKREKVKNMRISRNDEDLLEMLYYVPVSAFLVGDFVELERWIKLLTVFEFFSETYTLTKRSRHLFHMIANIYYFENLKREKVKNYRIFDYFRETREETGRRNNEEKIFVIGDEHVLPWAFHQVHPTDGPPSRLVPIFWDGLAIQDLQEPGSRAKWILNKRIQIEIEKSPKRIFRLIFMLGDQDLRSRVVNGKTIHPSFLQHTESSQIQILVNLYLSFLSQIHKRYSPNVRICVTPILPFYDVMEEHRIMKELFSTKKIFCENKVRLFSRFLKQGCAKQGGFKRKKKINFLDGLDSFVYNEKKRRVKRKFDLGYGSLVRVNEILLAEMEQKWNKIKFFS